MTQTYSCDWEGEEGERCNYTTKEPVMTVYTDMSGMSPRGKLRFSGMYARDGDVPDVLHLCPKHSGEVLSTVQGGVDDDVQQSTLPSEGDEDAE